MPQTTFYVNDTIPFTTCSENAVYYFWEFGDTHSANGDNVFHAYSQKGLYNVIHTTQGKDETDIKKSYIDILVIDSIISDFKIVTNPAALNEEIVLENKSVNAAKYRWDFGNGQTSTYSVPHLSYSSPGTYNITLKALSPDGQLFDTTTKTITILNIPDHSGNYAGTTSCDNGYNGNVNIIFDQNGTMATVIFGSLQPYWTGSFSNPNFTCQSGNGWNTYGGQGNFVGDTMTLFYTYSGINSSYHCTFTGVKTQ